MLSYAAAIVSSLVLSNYLDNACESHYQLLGQRMGISLQITWTTYGNVIINSVITCDVNPCGVWWSENGVGVCIFFYIQELYYVDMNDVENQNNHTYYFYFI